jgi:hypothetical protein
LTRPRRLPSHSKEACDRQSLPLTATTATHWIILCNSIHLSCSVIDFAYEFYTKEAVQVLAKVPLCLVANDCPGTNIIFVWQGAHISDRTLMRSCIYAYAFQADLFLSPRPSSFRHFPHDGSIRSGDTSLDLCEMLFQCTLSLHTSLLQHLYSSLHPQRIENARVTRVQTRSSFLLAG